jgi:hypothetical protein
MTKLDIKDLQAKGTNIADLKGSYFTNVGSMTFIPSTGLPEFTNENIFSHSTIAGLTVPGRDFSPGQATAFVLTTPDAHIPLSGLSSNASQHPLIDYAPGNGVPDTNAEPTYAYGYDMQGYTGTAPLHGGNRYLSFSSIPAIIGSLILGDGERTDTTYDSTKGDNGTYTLSSGTRIVSFNGGADTSLRPLRVPANFENRWLKNKGYILSIDSESDDPNAVNLFSTYPGVKALTSNSIELAGDSHITGQQSAGKLHAVSQGGVVDNLATGDIEYRSISYLLIQNSKIGRLVLNNCHNVTIKNCLFGGTVTLEGCSNVKFENCRFQGEDLVDVSVKNTRQLSVTGCKFVGSPTAFRFFEDSYGDTLIQRNYFQNVQNILDAYSPNREDFLGLVIANNVVTRRLEQSVVNNWRQDAIVLDPLTDELDKSFGEAPYYSLWSRNQGSGLDLNNMVKLNSGLALKTNVPSVFTRTDLGFTIPEHLRDNYAIWLNVEVAKVDRVTGEVSEGRDGINWTSANSYFTLGELSGSTRGYKWSLNAPENDHEIWIKFESGQGVEIGAPTGIPIEELTLFMEKIGPFQADYEFVVRLGGVYLQSRDILTPPATQKPILLTDNSRTLTTYYQQDRGLEFVPETGIREHSIRDILIHDSSDNMNLTQNAGTLTLDHKRQLHVTELLGIHLRDLNEYQDLNVYYAENSALLIMENGNIRALDSEMLFKINRFSSNIFSTALDLATILLEETGLKMKADNDTVLISDFGNADYLEVLQNTEVMSKYQPENGFITGTWANDVAGAGMDLKLGEISLSGITPRFFLSETFTAADRPYDVFTHTFKNGLFGANLAWSSNVMPASYNFTGGYTTDQGSGIYYNQQESKDFDLTEVFTIESIVRPGEIDVTLNNLYTIVCKSETLENQGLYSETGFFERPDFTREWAFGLEKMDATTVRLYFATADYTATSESFTLDRTDWFHVAVTGNGGTIKFYVNGVLRATALDGVYTARTLNPGAFLKVGAEMCQIFIDGSFGRDLIQFLENQFPVDGAIQQIKISNIEKTVFQISKQVQELLLPSGAQNFWVLGYKTSAQGLIDANVSETSKAEPFHGFFNKVPGHLQVDADTISYLTFSEQQFMGTRGKAASDISAGLMHYNVNNGPDFWTFYKGYSAVSTYPGLVLGTGAGGSGIYHQHYRQRYQGTNVYGLLDDWTMEFVFATLERFQGKHLYASGGGVGTLTAGFTYTADFTITFDLSDNLVITFTNYSFDDPANAVTLKYQSNSAVITPELIDTPLHLAVQWNNSTKTFRAFLNGTLIPMTLVSGNIGNWSGETVLFPGNMPLLEGYFIRYALHTTYRSQIEIEQSAKNFGLI